MNAMWFRALFVGLFVLAGTAAQAADAPTGNPTDTTKFINEFLTKAWKDNKITASGKSSDFEFVRRVHLDLIGRIPRPDEIRKFQGHQNRGKLINDLLHGKDYADEFAKHMADMWTVWTLTRSGNRYYHKQMQLWLESQFVKDTSYKDIAKQLIAATGKTNDNGAVNFVLAHLGERSPDGKVMEEGHFEMVPITSRTTRLFLGLQTQCVQCHDHPFNPEWKQQDFWAYNVFFRQAQRVGTPVVRQNNNNNVTPAILELVDDPKVNQDAIVYYERRNGMILPTSFTALLKDKSNISASKTRRELLADYVVGHENFPKAIAHRVWGLLFGRGMAEQPAVDDFGDHNKIVHEELLNRLAGDFAYNDAYDLKFLFKAICNSDAYQKTSVANNTNDKPETDVFFSRMQLKAMTPEQLLNSLWVATEGTNPKDTDAKEIEKRREDWNNVLVRNFGDDEGNEITFNGTVIQALLMMNGKEINKAIVHDRGVVATALNRKGASHGRIVSELYMAALGRPADGNEPNIISKVAKNYGGAVDRTFYADVMWALLNSNEFILNH